jgi:hypothetical protein
VTGQEAFLAGHCSLTDRYFEPWLMKSFASICGRCRCGNHPHFQLRAELNYERRSSTWLSKGASGSHLQCVSQKKVLSVKRKLGKIF